MSDHEDGPADGPADDPVASLLAAADPTTSFIDQSYLTYIIPSATNLNLEASFEGFDESKPIFDWLDQRDHLFFDETVNVLLMLETPWVPRQELNAHISRLSISMEAHITNAAMAGREANESTEIIFSGRLSSVSDPFIIEGKEPGDEEGEEYKCIYVMWKLPVLLARPRMRLHAPSIVFSASASLGPEDAVELYKPGFGYLPSGLPSGLNLLESFSSDPALHGIKPRLSALRVSRVAPVTRQQDVATRLRALPQLSLRIFPVVHTRIKFSRPTSTPPSSAVVALLEVDFTPHFNCEAILDRIDISTPDGSVENLNDAAGMKLPLSCVSHDHVTFLYHIKPNASETISRDGHGHLDISISAVVHITPGVCAPHLTMNWNTAIDLSHPINPSLGAAADPGIQRSSRPPPISTANAGHQVVTPLKSPTLSRPDALPTLEASTTHTEAVVPELGITMSFTAPSHPVRTGDVFSWTVYVVNRARDKSTRPARKLAFVAVPKRRRGEMRPVRPPSTGSRRRGEKEIADAVVDENVLHAIQKGAVVDATELICLSADTRVGPVAPGACHVVELQFLALREGIVGLEAIRVVDLNSQEHVDIRDLPTMIVQPVVA